MALAAGKMFGLPLPTLGDVASSAGLEEELLAVDSFSSACKGMLDEWEDEGASDDDGGSDEGLPGVEIVDLISMLEPSEDEETEEEAEDKREKLHVIKKLKDSEVKMEAMRQNIIAARALVKRTMTEEALDAVTEQKVGDRWVQQCGLVYAVCKSKGDAEWVHSRTLPASVAVLLWLLVFVGSGRDVCGHLVCV